MSAQGNGGPAFPASTVNNSGCNASDQFGSLLPPQGVACYPGMTLRDYFAAQVIGHLVISPVRQENTTEQDATYAYKVADAMLKARQP